MKRTTQRKIGLSPRNVATYAVLSAAAIGFLPVAAEAQTRVPQGSVTPGAKKMLPPAKTGEAAPAANVAPGKTPATPVKGNQTPAPVVNATKPAPKPSVKDLKVMAVVNSEPISRTDLANECVSRYGKEVLESLVNRQLIGQACDEAGIKITEQEVDEEIRRTASRFNLPVDKWLAMLKEERHMTPVQYRNEVIWPTLALRALAAEKIEVTDAEINREIESEYGPRVSVRMIAVSREQTAKDIHKKVSADPKLFPDLAKQFCEDPNVASVGGAIPPIRRHLGEKEFEDAAFALKPGQVSKILHVHEQYYILRCEGHTPARALNPKEAPAVKQALADRIRDSKLRYAATDLFKTLQDKSKTQTIYANPELAKQHPGVAAILNGKPISMQSLSEECLTRHGGDVLEGEINRKLLAQELARRNQKLTQAELDAEIDRAALSYGYAKQDGKADREKWLQQVETQEGASRDLYVKDAVWPSAALRKLAEPKVKVTKDDLQKGFESNFGPRVNVLAIVLTSQKEAQKVWEMARNGGTDEFFGELAGQYSIEPVSKSNAGQVPPIRKHGGQPKLEDEAFKLKPGELSGVIALGDKFVIVRCLGQTKPEVTKIEDVQTELEMDIREKKLNLAMSNEFESIRRNSQIDNYLAGSSQAPNRTNPAQPGTGGEAPKTAQGNKGNAPTGTPPATRR